MPLISSAAARSPYPAEILSAHGPAPELCEIHPTADFQRRWQAQPLATRPPFYLVFLLTQGEGLHRVGPDALYVRSNTLCFLSPGALATWQPGPALQQGYFCAFTEAFFQADRADQTLWRSLPFFPAADAVATLPLPPEAVGYFQELFAHLAADANRTPAEAAPLLRAQLTVLLLRAAALYRDALPAWPAPSAGQRLTAAFLALLEEDLAPLRIGQPIQQFSVRAYAQRLGVSQNHLNDSVRRQTGRSAGALVHDALADAATELLGRDARPVRDVAGLLGFTSATYFARFYRLRTGRCPSHQRPGRGSGLAQARP